MFPSSAHDVDRTYGSDPEDEPGAVHGFDPTRFSSSSSGSEEDEESFSETIDRARHGFELVAALDPELLSQAAANAQSTQELRRTGTGEQGSLAMPLYQEERGSSNKPTRPSSQSSSRPSSQQFSAPLVAPAQPQAVGVNMPEFGSLRRSRSDSVILPECPESVTPREHLDRDDILEPKPAKAGVISKERVKRLALWPIPCIGLPLIPVAVIMGVLVVTGFIFKEYWETAELLDLQLWEWCVLFGLTILTLMASLLGVNFVMFFVTRFLLRSSIYYYANGLKTPTMVAVWGLLMLIVGNVVLETWGDQDTFMWYVKQFFVCLLVVGLCYMFRVICEKTVLRRVANKQYFVKIRHALYREQMIQRILRAKKKHDSRVRRATRSRSPSSFVSSRGSSRMTVVEPRSGVPSPTELEAMGSEGSSGSGLYTPNEERKRHHFKVHASMFKSLTELAATNAPEFDAEETLSKREREARARQLAETIFTFLHDQGASRMQPITEESYLRPSDFVVIYASRHDRKKAYDMFASQTANGLVTPSVVESVMLDIYNERKSLADGLQDRNDVAAVLSGLVGVLFWTVMVVVVLLLMGADVNTVILPFASLLLGFSFAFGPTLRNVLEAGILILFVHPFDVGDRIYIGSLSSQPYFVEKMRLFRTTCRLPDNRWVAIPNSVLVNEMIFNYPRSGTVCLDLTLQLGFDTPWESIMGLRKRIQEHIEANKETFEKSFLFNIPELVEQNKIIISMWISLKYAPWCKVPDWLAIRTQVFSVIKAASEEFNISYMLPPQRFLGEDLKID
mmetsp:Transcript_13240/g.33781  ORF Transcript_13240/g.33781 Transcript_13240/m.33781 type:complete len:792 (+) Transcript_13240:164-2539(+)